MDNGELLRLTSGIVSAHVGANRVPAADLPRLLREVHEALASLAGRDRAPERPTPAVTVADSLASRDHILSMIDGRPYKSLKRHIEHHGYTPDSYRAAFDLPADYPLTAPGYSDRRRALAHKSGLGRRRRD